MTNNLKKIIPVIVSDIDGVLLQNKKVIPKVSWALKQVRKPLGLINPREYPRDGHTQLPFVLLTNNQFSHQIEKQRIEVLNEKFNLIGKELLLPNQFVMSYTAMKPYLQKHKDQLVLIAGSDECLVYLKDSKIENYIRVEEYAALFPFLVPISKRSTSEIESTKQTVLKRLKNLKDIDLKDPLQIDAVFILTDVVKWEESSQIICDLLTTSNGKIADSFQKTLPQETIPIYISSNAIIYREKGKLPKLGAGMLRLAIEECYQLVHGAPVPPSTFKVFGKPERSAFEEACKVQLFFIIHKFYSQLQEKKGLEQINNELFQAGQFYMIGDNYTQDILGARELGWKTILVKQQLIHLEFVIVFRFRPNHRHSSEKNLSDYIVRSFEEAIKLIFKKHHLNYF